MPVQQWISIIGGLISIAGTLIVVSRWLVKQFKKVISAEVKQLSDKVDSIDKQVASNDEALANIRFHVQRADECQRSMLRKDILDIWTTSIKRPGRPHLYPSEFETLNKAWHLYHDELEGNGEIEKLVKKMETWPILDEPAHLPSKPIK